MQPSSSLIEPNRCNCAALRKASRLISQLYDSALAPCGLKSTQFAMLSEIERRANEPPTIGELADALAMDQSTIGQNLRPLERDSLVALQRDGTDRRRRHVQLTRTGRFRLAAAHPLWHGAQIRFESSFGKQNAAKLRAVLLDIVREPAFAADEQASPAP